MIAVVVLAGCVSPQNLAVRYGWKAERLSKTDFRLTAIGSVGEQKVEGLAVAGAVAASAGFHSFIMVADPERPDSGSSYYWGDSYGGGPGICVWEIGSSFRIRGHHEHAKGRELWDSRQWATELLPPPKEPNKAPEPTPTAVTPRAMEMKIEMKTRNCDRCEARVAPAVGVAHL
jgi:hypothetical protein